MKLKDPFPGLTGDEVWLKQTFAPKAIGNSPLLIYFWSVDCCANERLLPRIAQWDAEYGTVQRIQIIGVHVARTAEQRDRGAILRAVDAYALQHPILLDDDGSIAATFGNRIVPATYFFDERLQLRHIQSGEQGITLLQHRLQSVLRVE
jgi:hypothetical protein